MAEEAINKTTSAIAAGTVTAETSATAAANATGTAKAAESATIEANETATAIAAETATAEAIAIAIETNATAGQAILPAGETETIIKSPFVTENTLVYITPLSDSENKVLYIKAKKAQEDEEKGWFKVAIDTPINKEIEFNWWLIN